MFGMRQGFDDGARQDPKHRVSACWEGTPLFGLSQLRPEESKHSGHMVSHVA